MKKENLFYLVFLITIFLIRLWVIIFPERDTYFLGFLIHHLWYGIILLLISFFIPRKSIFKIYLSAIGLGFVIDQMIFMLLGAGRDKEYWALPSLLGTIILIISIYPLRRKIIDFLKFS